MAAHEVSHARKSACGQRASSHGRGGLHPRLREIIAYSRMAPHHDLSCRVQLGAATLLLYYASLGALPDWVCGNRIQAPRRLSRTCHLPEVHCRRS